MKIKRGIGILLSGAGMFLVGHFLSQLVLNLIPTINPANSSAIADANYHMLSISNQLVIISQFGIIVMVIGGIVFFADKRKMKNSV
jgi:glucose uptake protein GlcU